MKYTSMEDKQKKDYTPVTVKLEKEDANILKKVCELNNTSASTFMRDAIISKMNEGAISNVAGNNDIDYNSETDSFVWRVKLEDGKEVELLDNISLEFLEDLSKQINFQIKKREEILGKKNKNSVAVPKRLLKK